MKKVFIKLAILFLIANIPVALYNFVFDPFGIFNDRSLRLGYEPGYEPNQHYAKMRHLINDEHSWDSYLFGSSRVGKINPDLLSGGKYYNLSYSEGIPAEHLDDIRLLLKNGVALRNVMVALDSFSYTLRSDVHRGHIIRHPYDDSLVGRTWFQLKYLCSAPQFRIMKYIRPASGGSLNEYNIMENGMQGLENIERKIEGDVDDHINSERFSRVNIPYTAASGEEAGQLMEETLKAISEIVKLSEEHSFKVSFLINPTHYLYYLKDDPGRLSEFKKRLARLTDYMDFSGLNSITTSNYYYYETLHYRTIVGDMIACRMSGCQDIELPQDFGLLVTAENVDRHISLQEKRLSAFYEGRQGL